MSDRLRFKSNRYGRRLFACVHYRPRTERYFRSFAFYADPLPRPRQLGVALGVRFWPEDEDGQRTLHVGLLVLHLHFAWDPSRRAAERRDAREAREDDR